jgi:hypothetical protein
MDEVLMLLEALIVILEWYIEDIIKSDVGFDEIIWKSNLPKYEEAFKMAFADGKIHPKERSLLKEKAAEFMIPDRIIETLENKLRLSYEKGNNGSSYFEQKMFYGNLYPAMDFLKRLFEEEKESGKIEILNIALDMSVTWPFLESQFNQQQNKNITFKSLVISPGNNTLLPSTWRRNIKTQIENYTDFLNEQSDEIAKRSIEIELRLNKNIPIIHGFLVNDKHLLWSFLDIKDGKISGGDNFYHYSTPEDSLGQYYINIFRNWFDAWWDKGGIISTDPKKAGFKSVMEKIIPACDAFNILECHE